MNVKYILKCIENYKNENKGNLMFKYNLYVELFL